jgi:hypothetical protein
MIPRWLKVLAGLGLFFVFVLFFLSDMSRNVEVAYARNVVFGLQQDRDAALRSDVPEAVERLRWIRESLAKIWETRPNPG